jgi:hypothetical protein
MPVAPDETEELLRKLEAELAEHQKKIDARLEREEKERSRLEEEVGAWTNRRDAAELMLELTSPRRNAMIQRRDELRLRGSKGNFTRAMLWSAGAWMLFMGATLAISVVAAKPDFFGVLLLELLGLGVGYGVSSWIDRGKEE